MYDHFFNLTAEPFRLSPDHRFCYNHARYAKAKAYIAYAFMRAEGFVMVTGRPGTGKTTLIGDLVASLADENVEVANLVSTQLAADDLLRMVAFAFGVDAQQMEKSTLLEQLTARFHALHRESGRALLIVDEAQDLTPEAMEELRLLTKLRRDGMPLLQIFLLGQPELRDLVHSQGLDQVHQRIIAASHLEALREDQTRAYVEHRLQVVGWRNDPAISTAVFPVIYLFSEGVPRRINLICSRLFLHCCVEQRHQITVADARAVVEELQEEQLSARNLLTEELFFADDVFDGPLPHEALVAAADVRARAVTAGARRREDQPENRQNYQVPDNPDVPDDTLASEPTAPLRPPVPEALSASPASGTANIAEDHETEDSTDDDFDQYCEQKPEMALQSRVGPVLNKGVWMTLIAALVTAGVVVLMMGPERFM